MRSSLNTLFIVCMLLISNLTFAAKQEWISWVPVKDCQVGSCQLSLEHPFIGEILQNNLFLKKGNVKVRLRYAQDHFYTTDDFELKVSYRVMLKTKSGQETSYTDELSISFSKDKAHIHTDVQEHNYALPSDQYVSAGVELLSKTLTGITTLNDDEVFLDLVYQSDHYYPFDVTEVPVAKHEVSGNTTSNGTAANELMVSWNHLVGAEEYDVEWLYINTGGNTDLTNYPVDFSQAYRVSVKDNKYRISLAYPKGHLLYRVRAKGVDMPVLQASGNAKMNLGAWSNQALSATASLDAAMSFTNAAGQANGIALAGFEDGLNWVYAGEFAEEGKLIEKVSFFDGSNRERQNIASVYADNTVIVGETKYDQEGRDAVSILPVPVASGGLKFYTNSTNPLKEFNGDFDYTDFSKEDMLDYENVADFANALPPDAEAAKFYSTGNTLNNAYKDYLPVANGYPYIQKIYSNDGRNLVTGTSSPGPEFLAKGQQGIRTYYTTPTQAELDRLFGNEVGYAAYYTKVIQKDQNGQYTVSYKNQAGKVIASAYSIGPERLLDLDEMEPTQTLTSDLLGEGSEWFSDGTLMKSASFFSMMGSSPVVKYGLTGISLDDPCIGLKDIYYDVLLYVEDEDGNLKSSITSDANGASTREFEMNVTGVTPLRVLNIPDGTDGTREILKKVRINETKFEHYFNELKAKLNTQLVSVKSHYQTDFRTQLENNPQNLALTPYTGNLCLPFDLKPLEPCFDDCPTACEHAYQGTDENGSTVYYDVDFNEVAQSSTAHADAIAACKASCIDENTATDPEKADIAPVMEDPCEERLEMMKAHMSPGGQYFSNTPFKQVINPVTGTFMNLDGETDPNSAYNQYTWLDGNLNLSTVKQNIQTELNINVSSITTWAELESQWQESFADVLVKMHPEYCAHQFFCADGTVQVCVKKQYTNRRWECFLPTNVNMAGARLLTRHLQSRKTNAQATFSIGSDNYNLFVPFKQLVTPFEASSNGIGANNKNYLNLQGTLPSGTTLANYLTGLAVDPISVDVNGNTNPLFQTEVIEPLLKFIPLGNNNFYSIWYLLENPDGIVLPASSPTSIEKLFDSFHNPTTGLFATGQLNKLEFFLSVYNFYREKFLYTNFEAGVTNLCGAGVTAAYWEKDLNYDGKIDVFEGTVSATEIADDDFALIYRRRYEFDHFTGANSFTSSSSQTTSANLLKIHLRTGVLQAAPNWMITLNGQGCLDNLTAQQKTNLREALIAVAEQAGKDAISVYTTNGTPLPPSSHIQAGADQLTSGSVSVLGPTGNSVTVTSFTDVLTAFGLSSCTLVHPVVQAAGSEGARGCNENLFTAAGFDITNTVAANVSAINSYLTTNSITGYPSTQVEKWVKFYMGKEGGALFHADGEQPFPDQLECETCKCEKITNIAAELGISGPYTVANLTQAQREEIRDAVNASIPVAEAVTTAQVDGWLTNCESTSTVNVFSGLPQSFRCLGDVEQASQTALQACLTNSFNIAMANAEASYLEALDEKLEAYRKAYYEKAKENLKARETMTLTYKLNEGYVTKYYYDQAGNLIKTVAPQGVDILDLSSTSSSGGITLGEKIVQARAGNGLPIKPNDKYVTNYRYNSFNQPFAQSTPDGGVSNFYYDDLERVVISQNAQQLEDLKVSYTNYDALGRVKEVGQGAYSASATPPKDLNTYSPTLLEPWKTGLSEEQIIQTDYEQPSIALSGFTPQNLRNRVAASYTFKTEADQANNTYEAATHYAYDIHGNVEKLAQVIPDITTPNQHLVKQIGYQYDLLSGKVNEVAYNPGERDEFYHRYFYDDNNRITEVETSRDYNIWDTEAKYFYYPHGPLARVEIGEKQVQAQDYVYTLQGWLKSVNASTLSTKRDVGKDAWQPDQVVTHNSHELFAPDAMAYSLHYYHEVANPNPDPTQPKYLSDYQSIETSPHHEFLVKDPSNAAYLGLNANFSSQHNAGLSGGLLQLPSLNDKKYFAQLFNGNISKIVHQLSTGTKGRVQLTTYRYDKANRIKSSKKFWNPHGVLFKKDRVFTSNSLEKAFARHDFTTQYEYDKNGNLKALLRNKIGANHNMDRFTYHYNSTDNKLRTIHDQAGKMLASVDLPDQLATLGGTFYHNQTSTHNYEYDKIGNLIKDKTEGLSSIDWNVQGKVKHITKNGAADLDFYYAADGNRIAKVVKTGTASHQWDKQYYVRDAQGNVMATYEKERTNNGCYKIINVPSTLNTLDNIDQVRLQSANNLEISVLDDRELNLVGNLVKAINSPAIDNLIAYKKNKQEVVVVYTGTELCSTKTLILRSSTPQELQLNMVATGAIETVKLTGRDIYGSSRLGRDQQPILASVTAEPPSKGGISVDLTPADHRGERILGYKRYELTNHLGNVYSVVSDRRYIETNSSDTKSTPIFTGPGKLQTSNFSGPGGWSQIAKFPASELTLDNGKLKVTSHGGWGGIEKSIQGASGNTYNVTFDLELTSSCPGVYVQAYDPVTGKNYSGQYFDKTGKHEFVFTGYSAETSLKIVRYTGQSTADFYVDNIKLEELEWDKSPIEIGLPESNWTSVGTVGATNNGSSFTWEMNRKSDRKKITFATESGSYYMLISKISASTGGMFSLSVNDIAQNKRIVAQNNGAAMVQYNVPFKAQGTSSAFIVWNENADGVTNNITVEGGVQLVKLKKLGEQSKDDTPQKGGWEDFNSSGSVVKRTIAKFPGTNELVQLVQVNKKSNGSSGVKRILSLKANKSYEISFDWYSQSVLGYYQIYDGIGFIKAESLPTSNGSTFKILITPRTDEIDLTIRLHPSAAMGKHEFGIDNFKIRELVSTGNSRNLSLDANDWQLKGGANAVVNLPNGGVQLQADKHYESMQLNVQASLNAYYRVKTKVSKSSDGIGRIDLEGSLGRGSTGIVNGTPHHYATAQVSSSNGLTVIFRKISGTGIITTFDIEELVLEELTYRNTLFEEDYNGYLTQADQSSGLFDSFDGWNLVPSNSTNQASIDEGRLKLSLTSSDLNFIRKAFATVPGRYYRVKLDVEYEGMGVNNQKILLSRQDQYGTTFQNISIADRAQGIFLARSNEMTIQIGASVDGQSLAEIYLDNIEFAEMDKVPGTTQPLPASSWTSNNTAFNVLGDKVTVQTTGNGVGVKSFMQGLMQKGKAYVVEGDFDVPTRKTVGFIKADKIPHNEQYFQQLWTGNNNDAFPFYSYGENTRLDLISREVAGVTFSAENMTLTELRKGRVLDHDQFNHDVADDPILIANRPGDYGFTKRLGIEVEQIGGRLKVTADQNYEGLNKSFHTVPGKYYKLSFDAELIQGDFSMWVTPIESYGSMHTFIKQAGKIEALFLARKTETLIRIENVGLKAGETVSYWLDNMMMEQMQEIPNSSIGIQQVNWQAYSGTTITQQTGYFTLQNDGYIQYIFDKEFKAGHYYAIKALYKEKVGSTGLATYNTNGNVGLTYSHSTQNNLETAQVFKANGDPVKFAIQNIGTNPTVEVHSPRVVELVTDNVVYKNDFEPATGEFQAYNAATTIRLNRSTKKVRVDLTSKLAGIRRSFETVPGQEYEITFDLSMSSGTSLRLSVYNYEEKNSTDNWKFLKDTYINTSGQHSFTFTAEEDHVIFVLNKINDKLSGIEEYFELGNFTFKSNEDLLSNLTFDDLEGWKPYQSGAVLQLDPEGKLKVVAPTDYRGTELIIETEPGEMYDFSFDLGIGTTNGVYSNIVDKSTGTSNVILQEIATQDRQISQRFTAISTETRIVLSRQSGTGPTNYFTVDNTSIKKVSSGNMSTQTSQSSSFIADVMSVTDYYPFGMTLPGRNYNQNDYKYGFQGQEKDDEIKGAGNSVNYKYRMHDPRVGRFLSIDPLTKDFPHNSPYAFSENRVIDGVEFEGLEYVNVIKKSDPSVSTVVVGPRGGDFWEGVDKFAFIDNHNFSAKDQVLLNQSKSYSYLKDKIVLGPVLIKETASNLKAKMNVSIHLSDVQWKTQAPNWKACHSTCVSILKKSGVESPGLRNNSIQVAKENSSATDISPTSNFEKGIEAINESLENSEGVIVGVNHTFGNKYNEGTTDHFVVINGKGYDEERNQMYYTFLEVGTQHKKKGASSNNRLYLDEKNKTLSGKTVYKPGRIYTVSQVRKNG